MTTVVASCPSCGEVSMNSGLVRLVLCDNVPDLSTFCFSCPSCRQQVEKEACDHQIAALLTAGVIVQRWTLPAELLEQHDGPPICFDDLLDFHVQLQDPDVWAELMG